MTKQKKNYELAIYGKKYGIKSDLGDEKVYEIAKFVDEKIKEVAGPGGPAANLNVVVLACLNIAEDYFRLKGELEQVDDRCKGISEMVDSCLNAE
jgi:cell division protein ZapA